MSFRKVDGNFSRQHWDKLAALGGLAVLALVAAYKFNLISFPGKASLQMAVAGATDSMNAETPESFEEFDKSLKDVFNSHVARLTAVSDGKASFLASESREKCVSTDPKKPGCGGPIKVGAKVCPLCGANQTNDIVKEASRDSDEDGLLDDYEIAHKLDPKKNDANEDRDGDGFTNIEEFNAKTSPSDPLSHPGYIDYIAVGSVEKKYATLKFVEARPLKLQMKGVPLTDKDYRYMFDLPERRKEADRGSLSALKDEEIANSEMNTIRNPNAHYKAGFVVVAYRYKAKKVDAKWDEKIKLPKDISEVDLKRVSDGKIITFVINAKETLTDIEATISCDRAGVGGITLMEGQKFKIGDEEYAVERIFAKGEGRDREGVVVKNLKTGKSREIESP